tara:strand:+ start:37500 stop:37925 length:426 start_codon:yes stop_codon:yes gene_type:complete
MKISIHSLQSLRIFITKLKNLIFILSNSIIDKGIDANSKNFFKEFCNFSNIYLIDLNFYLILYIRIISNANITSIYTNKSLFLRNLNFLKILKINSKLIKDDIFLPDDFRKYSLIVPELIITSKKSKVTTNIKLIKEIKLN